MNKRTNRSFGSPVQTTVVSGLILLFLSELLIPGKSAIAQIVPDQTLGSENSLFNPGQTIQGLPTDLIDGGAIRGVNLFHSFKEFNVGEAQRVYFSNPAGIETILSRVTGNNLSQILGTLGVTGTANLFLLNPNGILFGPNARLDIRGSFFATTAEQFIFPDGSNFSAVNPQAPPLLMVNLPIGVQFGDRPTGTISNQGILSVGKDLTLSAASVTSTGQLLASTGKVRIEGLAGDVKVQSLLAQTAQLSASNNLQLLESNLQTTGDLTLSAGNTVQVRDSLSQPLLLSAGGQLLIQGQQSIDIFALNHPSSALISGQDLILRSATPVIGDAHYYSGGNFRIEQLDGSLGELFSPYDPIIRATGNVAFTSYRGFSLHILAGGSITINSVTITGRGATATATALAESITLSDGTSVLVNGGTVQGGTFTGFPTLDLRAGIDLAYLGTPGQVLAPTPAAQRIFTPGAPGTGGTGTSAAIEIGSIQVAPGSVLVPEGTAQVLLTNQYYPNTSLQGNIKVSGLLTTNATSTGNSGAVYIDSRNGIDLFQINTTSNDRNGGNVKLLANDNITLNSIGTSGLLGGKITLTSRQGEISLSGINNGLISTSTGNTSGTGGDITINTRTFRANDSAINVNSQSFSANAGKISITATDGIFLKGGLIASRAFLDGSNTNAGDIILSAPTVSLDAANLSSSNARNGSGKAGNIIIRDSNSVSLQGAAITTTVNQGSSGPGGDVRITNVGTLAMNNSNIQTQTQGSGNAGIIEIQARESVNLNATEINSNIAPIGRGSGGKITINAPTLNISNASFVLTNVSAGGIGKGGDISFQTNSLTANGGSQIKASTAGSGNAGTVQINASDQASFSGQNTGVFVNTSSSSNAGSITVNTNRFRLTDRAVLDARTLSSGQGGSVTVNAIDSEISGGAQILTNTSSSGAAGDITFNSRDRLLITGANSGFFASTEKGSTGKSGSISVDPIVVLITDGAAISVNSQGAGNGGNLFLQGGSLTLDNASLSATSFSAEGGNITLQIKDILLMRNGSSISATAGLDQGNGNGGNINIDAGFIVAVPTENSDISANAFRGRGGNIRINTQGLFGIEYQFFPTNLSGITASSTFGVNGIVSITTPGIDPNKGLQGLPANLVDASQLVAKGCARNPGGVGRFVATGQGGLPPAPGESLSSDAIAEDIRLPGAIARQGQNLQAKAPVPAQGWLINAKGELILTAQVPSQHCYGH